MGRAARVVGEFREQLRRLRAELKGEARSRARLIKRAMDVPEIRDRISTKETVKYKDDKGNDQEAITYRLNRVGPARPVKGAAVRMLDGKPMIFFDDGSLRHMMGFKPGKAARKALKRHRQEQARRA